ncbi:Crp/Fnr family transcriptional regulator (plasmid) [Streptomycetaceae bacterium NBC_01309]
MDTGSSGPRIPRQRRTSPDATDLRPQWFHDYLRDRLPPFPEHSFLGALGDASAQRISRYLGLHYMASGATLEIARSGALYLVLDGVVRETPLIGGAAHTTLRLPGDIVESSTVFDAQGGSVAMRGVRASLLGVLPRQILRRLLAESPTILSALAHSMAQREKAEVFFNVHVRCGPTGMRIARYLVFLTDLLGGGQDRQVLGFSQRDIAQAVGAGRASAEAFFREQRDAGVLTTRYRTIHIHQMPALRALVGDMPIWRN